MSNNIKQTATIGTTSPILKTGSAVKAIIIASLFKILGAMVLGFIIGFIYIVIQIDTGVSQAGIISIAEHIDLLSPFGVFCTIVGFLLSFCAGYLCAEISETNIYRNTAVVCSISVCFTMFVGADSYPVIENLVLAVISTLGMFFGAYTLKKKLA